VKLSHSGSWIPTLNIVAQVTYHGQTPQKRGTVSITTFSFSHYIGARSHGHLHLFHVDGLKYSYRRKLVLAYKNNTSGHRIIGQGGEDIARRENSLELGHHGNLRDLVKLKKDS